jgi:hypothetical protein
MKTAKFPDANGQDWILEIRLGDLPRLAEVGLDLDQVSMDPKGLLGVMALPPKITGAVLWLLCEAQALTRSLTPEQFAGRFDGLALERARLALAQAVIDFFRFPGTALLPEKLPQILAAADKAVETELRKRLADLESSEWPGASPANSASTPAS